MSTITPSDPGLTASLPNVVQKKWAMTSADTGVGVSLPNFPDKTITVTGTWGSATLVVQGANEDVDASYINMTDPQGNAISKTSDFIEALLENPLFIRVKTSGGTNSVLTAIVTGRQ